MLLRKPSGFHRRVRPKRSPRLLLERLEPRVVLSVFNVSTESGLRAAISAADTNSASSNTINITSSIVLSDTTAGPLVIENATDISKSLTLDGQGDLPAISGATTWDFRFIDVDHNPNEADESVDLENLDFEGGDEVSSTGDAQGGAIMLNGEDLTLSNDIVSGNKAKADNGTDGSGQNGYNAEGGATT